MQVERREFLSLMGLAGAAPSSVDRLLHAAFEQSADTGTADEVTFKFWTSQVRQQAGGTRGGTTTPQPTISGPPANYVYFNQNNGFQLATSLDRSGLPDSGDIGLNLGIQAFRPSKQVQTNLAHAKVGSLRVDLHQVSPLPGLSEPLSWSTIANIPQKLIGYRDLNFDAKSTWGAWDLVPLPQGKGKWTWNLFTQKDESIWAKMVHGLAGVDPKLLAPLGYPAVAATALKAVDGLFAYIWSRVPSTYVLNSTDTPLVATKKAAENLASRAVPLVAEKANDGYYVVAPEPDANKILGAKNLLIRDGLLIPSDTPKGQEEEAAGQTLPDVSYLTFQIVTPKIQIAGS
jgi:hypothetical protein